jgi:hypothetical protein
MKNQTKTKIKKHKPASLKYNVNQVGDYKTITDQPKTKAFIYMNLVNAVKVAVEENLDSIDLFKLADSNVCFVLNKDGWKISLSNAIQFFTEKEMFETCIECQRLIEIIE